MIDFGIKDVVDIVLVAMMLYYVYRLMKESRSLNVFIGIIVFVIVWLFVSQIIEMRLLGSIMDKLVSVGVIGLIVLFQEEIRKFLYTLGTHRRFQMVTRFFFSGNGFRIVDAVNKRRGKVYRFLRNYGYYILLGLILESFICRLFVNLGAGIMDYFNILGWFMTFATGILGWPVTALWGLVPW